MYFLEPCGAVQNVVVLKILIQRAEPTEGRRGDRSVISLRARTCIQRCSITDALKWLLGSLKGDDKSKRLYSLSYEVLLSVMSVCNAEGFSEELFAVKG